MQGVHFSVRLFENHLIVAGFEVLQLFPVGQIARRTLRATVIGHRSACGDRGSIVRVDAEQANGSRVGVMRVETIHSVNQIHFLFVELTQQGPVQTLQSIKCV